jgi:hypothetical protein
MNKINAINLWKRAQSISDKYPCGITYRDEVEAYEKYVSICKKEEQNYQK